MSSSIITSLCLPSVKLSKASSCFISFSSFSALFTPSNSSTEILKNKAISEIKTDVQVKISGFDIDEKQIALARRHAEEAGVKDCIHFQRMDMREFSSSHKRGVIITNPPYGERLMTRQEIVGLYRDFGKTYSKLDDWCCYVLTSVSDFENLFGKRSDKKRKIYNGNLECNLYRFLAKLPKKDKNM